MSGHVKRIKRHVIAVFAAAVVVVCMAGWCCADDVGTAVASLLQNGGFEDGGGGGPFSWLVSVVSAEGASSLWDDQVSRGGLRSVQLSTATRYTSEPYNNWSQNIGEPLGGKHVVVRGYVKGHNVENAVLWLQCFQRGSAIPIADTASNKMQPLHGSFGWTEQEASLYVPQSTDLVIVRLALIGTGTVWFDDIVMEIVEPETRQPPVPSRPSSEQTAAPEADTTELAAALESVAEQNRKLCEANEQLSRQIDQLAQRVQSLQTFLEEMQAAGPVSTETSLPFIIPPRNIPSRSKRLGTGTD